jgi:serine/threonine-protein phosphatase CPPED1
VNHWLRGWVFAGAALVLSLSTVAAETPGKEAFAPFTFALVGDPQIGYGTGAEYADAQRFGRVVDDIAAQQMPVSVVVGDLVEDRSLWQHWAYQRVARGLPGRVLLLPGNHDVTNRASLADWRTRHGPDYHDAVHHNVAFVLLNSETARDDRLSGAEHEAQWAWLARTLAAHHAAGRTHIVLAMHRPPFVENEDEGEENANWPPAARARLLALARAHGVRWILAGHLHRTTTIRAADGLTIVVGAGSARSFDRSPIAWHRVRVSAEGLAFEQRVVAPPPAEPFSVPGLRDWTPRLFDFSLRHWILTAAYLACAFWLFATGRQQRGAGKAAAPWPALAVLLLALGLNMQLDIDELLREVGRIAAKLSGVHAVRHAITGGAVAAALLGGAFWLWRAWRHGAERRLGTAAIALAAVPVAWFALSAISHHDLGMLFNEGWWDLAIVGALVSIALCAAFARRTTR